MGPYRTPLPSPLSNLSLSNLSTLRQTTLAKRPEWNMLFHVGETCPAWVAHGLFLPSVDMLVGREAHSPHAHARTWQMSRPPPDGVELRGRVSQLPRNRGFIFVLSIMCHGGWIVRSSLSYYTITA